MKTNIIISLSICCLFFGACGDKNVPDPVGVKEPPRETVPPEEDNDEEEENTVDIIDHPRLLLLKDSEQSLRSSITRNSEFKTMHNYILQVSDELLSEAPLVYKKEGKRLLAISRAALKRLFYLSYAHRISKERKYLVRAEQELIAVCGFPDWNPSHFLDVGEMCTAVALAYDWLYHDLQKSTHVKVRKAIVEKAFKPSYVGSYNGFLTLNNNWNQVCNAGLVFGALAIFEDEPIQAQQIIDRALVSLRAPSQMYGPDGNYPEGPGYWMYGTTYQVMLSAALETALGSDRGLSKAPGFLESGYYMLFMTGPSDWYFNYSDGGRALSANPVMFWYAQQWDDPTLIFNEIPLIRKGVYTKVTSTDMERFLPSALVFGKDLTIANIPPPAKKLFVGHGTTPVVVVRTDWNRGHGKYLGIKGGRASNAHGHMDQGAFVYDIGTLRWAMDFGLQSYSTLESQGVDLWNMGQTSERWDIFRYSNVNHNTLTINNQRHNVKGDVSLVEVFEDAQEQGATFDLRPALNLHNELKSAMRKAVIKGGASLTITDVLETNAAPVMLRWNMATPASAEIIDESTIKLSQQDKTLLLKIRTKVPIVLAIRPSENPSLYKSPLGNYYYESYNQTNPGTVMVGFDANIPANTRVTFTVDFEEQI